MPETLFLTTNLIDRFLEIKGVTRKNLQLVGPADVAVAVVQSCRCKLTPGTAEPVVMHCIQKVQLGALLL